MRYHAVSSIDSGYSYVTYITHRKLLGWKNRFATNDQFDASFLRLVLNYDVKKPARLLRYNNTQHAVRRRLMNECHERARIAQLLRALTKQ